MTAEQLNDAAICDLIRARLDALSPRRVLALAALLPLVGLEPIQQAYRAAMYPFDPPSEWEGLSKKSDCGKTTEIGWRAAGVKDARLYMPSGVRGARGGDLYPVTLERAIAQKWGGWRSPDPKSQALPLDGDAVIIGCSAPGIWGKGGYAKEHEFTVGTLDRLNGYGEGATIHNIEGGQPGVHGRTRALVWCGPNGTELWCASLDSDGAYAIDPVDARPTRGRKVLGWVDTDALDDA